MARNETEPHITDKLHAVVNSRNTGQEDRAAAIASALQRIRASAASYAETAQARGIPAIWACLHDSIRQDRPRAVWPATSVERALAGPHTPTKFWPILYGTDLRNAELEAATCGCKICNHMHGTSVEDFNKYTRRDLSGSGEKVEKIIGVLPDGKLHTATETVRVKSASILNPLRDFAYRRVLDSHYQITTDTPEIGLGELYNGFGDHTPTQTIWGLPELFDKRIVNAAQQLSSGTFPRGVICQPGE